MGRPRMEIDEEKIIEWIRQNTKNGYAPTQDEYNSCAVAAGLPSRYTFQIRGLSWKDLTEKAGVPRNIASWYKRAPFNDKVLADILEWIRQNTKNGYAPTLPEYNKVLANTGWPSINTLATYGYRWKKLVEMAGCQPSGKHAGSWIKRLERIDKIVNEMKQNAEPPRADYWPMHAIPTKTVEKIWRASDGSIVKTTIEYKSLR